MVETIIRNYLVKEQSLPVVFEKQPGMEEYYLLEKTGSSEENHIRTAMMAVQSYAGSKARAAQLSQEVIDLLLKATQLEKIASVSLNSDYDFTDTSTKTYRYQAVFDIVHY